MHSRLYRHVRDGAIELVTIDVRNLWRLQAQRGAFVFADFNWDIFCPLDRIIFPYTRYPAYPTREQVYPRDKSPLEQLLDRYFWIERQTLIRIDIETMERRGRIVTLTGLPEGYLPAAFTGKSRMVALKSWSREALQDWDVYPEEDSFGLLARRFS